MRTSLLLVLLLTMFGLNRSLAQCSAAFTFTSSPNGTYTFTATGANSPSTIYQWNFGNGNLGSGSPASTQYTTPGTYTVTLMATDTLSNCFDSTYQFITVTNSVGCLAAFTYSVSGNTVYFTNTSSSANPLTYLWTVNGNNIGSTANPSWSGNPGTYTVCLYITDALTACTDSACQQITLGAAPTCQAGFYIYPDSNGPAHTYIGVNTSTGMSPTGTYTWTWGDGSSSTGQYPSHTYASAGNYVICLMIADPNSACVDTFCMTSTINKTATMYSINFLNPTGVNEVAAASLRLFPNPAGNHVLVEGLKGQGWTADIYSLNGTRIGSRPVSAEGRIELGQWPAQLYMLRLSNGKGDQYHLKLMLQH